MSEGSSFEQQQEIPPKSQADLLILEKGEIESARELKGYWGIQLVEIKDDGYALFRPDFISDFMFEAKGMTIRRSDLELMAYKIDQILEFNLVPTVVNRTIRDHEGSLQRRIQHVYHAFGIELEDLWNNEVKLEEITRAAVFDYLLDVKDRHLCNFIIDSYTGKLWLIDHDFYMFFWEGEPPRTDMVKKAQEKGLIILGETEKAALERFLAHSDSLTIGAKPEIVEIIQKARARAELLLEEGQIPA